MKASYNHPARDWDWDNSVPYFFFPMNNKGTEHKIFSFAPTKWSFSTVHICIYKYILWASHWILNIFLECFVCIQHILSVMLIVPDIKYIQTSGSSFVRKSAASMLSGKKPVPAAVSSFFLIFFSIQFIFFLSVM